MALHGAPPGQGGVQAGVVGLGADGCGIEQHLGPHQGHGAGALRVPLVPADADADAAEAGVPDPETRVAGPKIVLLHIARAVRDVALAIDAHQRPVGVDHHQAVEIVRPLALEDRDRQHHAQFRRQRCQRGNAGVLTPGVGGGEPTLFLRHAEVRALEQFGRQDDLGTTRCGLTNEAGSARDIGRHVIAIGGLDGGDAQGAGHQAGSCWVMQWKDPPPVRIAVEGNPTTARSGNTCFSISTANLPGCSV